MQSYQDQVFEAAAFLKGKITEPPVVGFLTGTGLSACTASIKVDWEVPYGDIPHFPVSTVESHAGKLIIGTLEGVSIMAMQGRFHLYEGYSPLEVTFPIRVMQVLGVSTLVISNASGGINLDFREGDVMVIRDHINLTGKNPLVGPNHDPWGDRFPDMTGVYHAGLAEFALESARSSGLTLREGVYAGLMGPSLETPAETRYLKVLGSDAVGFSTVMEAVVGVHAGMKILGLATITNINDPDNPRKATVEEIINIAQGAAAKVDAVLSGIIPFCRCS